jgi:hypothetical protein
VYVAENKVLSVAEDPEFGPPFFMLWYNRRPFSCAEIAPILSAREQALAY